MIRIRPTCAALCLGACLLGAADEAAVQPADHLLEEALFELRLHDLQRSRDRFADSPWGRLWQLPEAAGLRAMMADELAEGRAETPELGVVLDALPGIRRAALGFDMSGAFPAMKPRARVAVEHAEAATLAPQLVTMALAQSMGQLVVPDELPPGVGAALLSSDGEGGMAQLGDLLLLGFQPTAGLAELLTTRTSTPPDRSPEADLELSVDVDRYMQFFISMLDGMGAMGMGDVMAQAQLDQFKEMAALFAGAGFHLDARLAPQGFDERWRFEAGDERLRALMTPELLPPFDRGIVESLPADTLWMLGWHTNQAGTERFLELFTPGAAAAGNPDIDQLLAIWGLPPVQQLQTALDGDSFLYATAPTFAGGLPSLTLDLAIDQEIGRQLLDAAVLHVPGLVREPDGLLRGMLGIVPVQISCVDGHLQATTDMRGLAAHRERVAGFTTDPAIAAAFAELPGDAYVVGLSRSQASWGAVHDLAMAFLTMAGGAIPNQDLIARIPGLASWGMLWMRPDGSMRAVGLITPMSLPMLAGMVAPALAMERMRAGGPRRGGRPQAPPPIVEEAEPDPAF